MSLETKVFNQKVMQLTDGEGTIFVKAYNDDAVLISDDEEFDYDCSGVLKITLEALQAIVKEFSSVAVSN